MKKEKKSSRVNSRITDTQSLLIDKICEENNVNRSKLIRFFVIKSLNEYYLGDDNNEIKSKIKEIT